jgi:hypothetical protein
MSKKASSWCGVNGQFEQTWFIASAACNMNLAQINKRALSIFDLAVVVKPMYYNTSNLCKSQCTRTNAMRAKAIALSLHYFSTNEFTTLTTCALICKDHCTQT